MKPAVAPARKELRAVLRHGLEWMLNQGNVWLRTVYMPALQSVASQAASEADQALAAQAWCLLGELWMLNDAPRAATRAFQACLELAPETAEAWFELARIAQATGQRRLAAEALGQAVAIHPELQESMEDALFWDEVRFRAGDATWKAAEALADGEPERALELLTGGRATLKIRRWRACAHAALGDVDAALTEWQDIRRRTRGPVLIGYADWFYLPEAAWTDARLWESLEGLGSRLDEEGIYPSDDSLASIRKLTEVERAQLTFARRAAEARGDVEKLRRMCRERPRWQEARESLQAISS